MANAVIFLGWNRPVVGREEQAMQLFQKSLEFYGKLLTEGRIEGFEPVLLTPHGGNLAGFILVRGEAKKLSELKGDETFVSLSVEADFCLDDVRIVEGHIGDGLNGALSRWAKLFS